MRFWRQSKVLQLECHLRWRLLTSFFMPAELVVGPGGQSGGGQQDKGARGSLGWAWIQTLAREPGLGGGVGTSSLHATVINSLFFAAGREMQRAHLYELTDGCNKLKERIAVCPGRIYMTLALTGRHTSYAGQQ